MTIEMGDLKKGLKIEIDGDLFKAIIMFKK